MAVVADQLHADAHSKVSFLPISVRSQRNIRVFSQNFCSTAAARCSGN